MDTYESDVKNTRVVTIGLASVAFVLITGVTSCLMNDSNLEAVNTAARAEYLAVQTAQEREQNTSIQSLIEQGVNPVAARCAIIGWQNERDSIVCAAANSKSSNTTTDNITGPK